MLDYYKYKPVDSVIRDPDITINQSKLGLTESGPILFFETYKDKTVQVVKSDTGTGKTTEFKNYIRETGHGFISIVSRVSLGKEQAEVFREAGIPCHFHEEITAKTKQGGVYWRDFEGENLIITIDSLLKIRNWSGFQGYTIYLDEYNSLIQYLVTCNLKTIQSGRIEIMGHLEMMIRQSDRTICTDADINEISLRFLEQRDITYSYIKNEYKHNHGVKASEIFSFNLFIKALEKEPKWMACCDSKSIADVVANLNKETDYLLITSEGVCRHGIWTKDTPNLDSCDRVIFSPAVMYGLDSTMKRPVFCYFKEHTISPEGMVQQLSRCRDITYLKYIFGQKKWTPYNYHSHLQALDIFSQREDYGVSNLRIFNPVTGEHEESKPNKHYLELRSKYEYRDDCFRTNKFAHFLRIIKERGFKIQAQFSQSSQKGEKEEELKVADLKLEEFLDYCEVYKGYFATYEQKNEDDWGDIISYFPERVIDINTILRIPYTMIDRYGDLFLGGSGLSHHFNLTKFMYNDKCELKHKLDQKRDYWCNKAVMMENKQMLLMKYRGLCGLSSEDKEAKTDIEVKKGVGTDKLGGFFKEYRLVYRCEKSKCPNLTDTYESLKFLAEMYKTLFGKVINATKSTKNGKSITYYSFNHEEMERHHTVKTYRDEYAKRKEATKYAFLEDSEDE